MAIKIRVTIPSEKNNILESFFNSEVCPFDGKVPCSSDTVCGDCLESNIEWCITYPAGYWVCPECSFRNRPEYDYCQNCSEDKPHNAEVIT